MMRTPDVARATTFRLEDGAWIVFAGDLDRPDVDRLKDEVLEIARATGGRLVLDMRGATFFGAAAIGLVGDAVRAAPGPVDALTPRGAERLLRLCGLGPPRLRFWVDADALLATIEPRASVPEAAPAGAVAGGALATSYRGLIARFRQLHERRRRAVERARALRAL
jgi:hypothetical protein